MESASVQKPVAFDINMKATNATTPATTDVQERLEKRKQTSDVQTDKFTKEVYEQKLERAREKRDKRMEALKTNTSKKYFNAEDVKAKFEKECENLKKQMAEDQARHEERRKEQISKVQQKATADLEKVKEIKQKMVNKENVSSPNTEAQ